MRDRLGPVLPSALAAAMLSLATACQQPPPDDPADEIRARLAGTWLRDYELEGTRVRRILVLREDGEFRELSRTLGPAEAGALHQHEGHWSYDGTNLKRRYTRMDGRLPSAPIVPFATLQLRLDSRHEFTGIDNVRGRDLRYHRVPVGTLP